MLILGRKTIFFQKLPLKSTGIQQKKTFTIFNFKGYFGDLGGGAPQEKIEILGYIFEIFHIKMLISYFQFCDFCGVLVVK